MKYDSLRTVLGEIAASASIHWISKGVARDKGAIQVATHSGSRGDCHLSVKHHIHEEWAVLFARLLVSGTRHQDVTHPIKAGLGISVVKEM
jgi:hypothetical protein